MQQRGPDSDFATIIMIAKQWKVLALSNCVENEGKEFRFPFQALFFKLHIWLVTYWVNALHTALQPNNDIFGWSCTLLAEGSTITGSRNDKSHFDSTIIIFTPEGNNSGICLAHEFFLWVFSWNFPLIYTLLPLFFHCFSTVESLNRKRMKVLIPGLVCMKRFSKWFLRFFILDSLRGEYPNRARDSLSFCMYSESSSSGNHIPSVVQISYFLWVCIHRRRQSHTSMCRLCKSLWFLKQENV